MFLVQHRGNQRMNVVTRALFRMYIGNRNISEDVMNLFVRMIVFICFRTIVCITKGEFIIYVSGEMKDIVLPTVRKR